MRIEPLRDVVLVRVLEPASYSGPILLPQRADPVVWATVVETGPECVDTTVGDVVLVSLLAGTAVADMILLPEMSILGSRQTDL